MVFSISLTCPLMSQCWLILLFDPWRSRSWLRPCSQLCSMVLLSMYRKAFLSYLKEWQQEMSSHIDSQHHFFTHRFKRQPRRRLFAALISVRADIGGDNSVFSSSRHNKSRFLVIATSFFYFFLWTRRDGMLFFLFWRQQKLSAITDEQIRYYFDQGPAQAEIALSLSAIDDFHVSARLFSLVR